MIDNNCIEMCVAKTIIKRQALFFLGKVMPREVLSWDYDSYCDIKEHVTSYMNKNNETETAIVAVSNQPFNMILIFHDIISSKTIKTLIPSNKEFYHV